MRCALTVAVFLIIPTISSCGSPPDTSDLLDRNPANSFPLGPDPALTPGETCQHADCYRYPERIAYCNRNVQSSTKWEIIYQYDAEFGYEVERMNRSDFKIDHYIPLCMGGSNSRRNLWPQHKSVYRLTDPLEAPLCELMAQGKLLQADAIRMIREAKIDLSTVPAVEKEIKSLRRD